MCWNLACFAGTENPWPVYTSGLDEAWAGPESAATQAGQTTSSSLFSSGKVKRAKRSALLAWDDFHAHSRFARSMYYPWGKLETTLSLSHNESSHGRHGLLLFFPFFSFVFCQNMLPQVTQTFIMTSAEIFELASIYSRKPPILAGGSRPCAQGQSVGSEEKAWRKFPSRRAEEPRPVLENGSHSCVF